MQNLLSVDLFLQVSGLTPGRAAALLPGLMGLTSLIIGWIARARAGRVNAGRLRPILALILGGTGVLLSVIHLARTTGGFGTGSGKLGAIVALVLSSIGIVLSARALTRMRDTARGGQ